MSCETDCRHKLEIIARVLIDMIDIIEKFDLRVDILNIKLDILIDKLNIIYEAIEEPEKNAKTEDKIID